MCTPSVRGRPGCRREPMPIAGAVAGSPAVDTSRKGNDLPRSLPRCEYAFRFNTPLRFDLLFSFSLSLCHTLRQPPLMTITTDTRKPYSGNKRSLVLAFDVGTTFSGVSYAILEPNEVPKIHGVTRCVQSIPLSSPLICLISASRGRNMWLEATKYPPSCTTIRTAT